jgi:hypothetical protein
MSGTFGSKNSKGVKVDLTDAIENSRNTKKIPSGDTESFSESENDHPKHNLREQRLAARRSVKFRKKYFPENEPINIIKRKYTKCHRTCDISLQIEINIS